MKTITRTVAIAEMLLVFPAAVFMAALFLRAVQPATQAGRLVEWFSGLPVQVGLYLLLVALPFGAFVLGGVILLRRWSRDTEFREATLKIRAILQAQAASLLIAAVTLMSAVILALVAIHMITE